MEFEKRYLTALSNLEALKSLLKEPCKETLVPLAGGVALQLGTIHFQSGLIVQLGSEYFVKVDSFEEALAILERSLVRAQIDWAEFVETNDTNEVHVKRFHDQFDTFHSEKQQQQHVVDEKEMIFQEETLYFEPYEM